MGLGSLLYENFRDIVIQKGPEFYIVYWVFLFSLDLKQCRSSTYHEKENSCTGLKFSLSLSFMKIMSIDNSFPTSFLNNGFQQCKKLKTNHRNKAR